MYSRWASSKFSEFMDIWGPGICTWGEYFVASTYIYFLIYSFLDSLHIYIWKKMWPEGKEFTIYFSTTHVRNFSLKVKRTQFPFWIVSLFARTNNPYDRTNSRRQAKLFTLSCFHFWHLIYIYIPKPKTLQIYYNALWRNGTTLSCEKRKLGIIASFIFIFSVWKFTFSNWNWKNWFTFFSGLFFS